MERVGRGWCGVRGTFLSGSWWYIWDTGGGGGARRSKACHLLRAVPSKVRLTCVHVG